MKILQLIHKQQRRGAETFASQLSNHLISTGHEVEIVSIYNGEDKLPFLSEIPTLNASPKKRLYDFNSWNKLSKIIKEFNPDIIQTNSGDTLKYAVFSKMVYRWKQPIVCRNASEVGQYIKSSFQMILNKFLYMQVERVISVSKASETDILNHFPFLTGKTKVIPVGLENNTPIVQKTLFPKGVKHIVHVGGFSFEKNHDGIVSIFKLILKENKNVHLHLVGDGPLKKNIDLQIEKYKLRGKVSFYGFVQNPLDFINGADVLILPSIIEGLPGVLLEAMYCKTPVVAYNVGGISEIVSEKTGSLVKKGDELKFAKKVLEILHTPITEQIDRAYSMVTNNYMNVDISQIFAESYREVLNNDKN